MWPWYSVAIISMSVRTILLSGVFFYCFIFFIHLLLLIFCNLVPTSAQHCSRLSLFSMCFINKVCWAELSWVSSSVKTKLQQLRILDLVLLGTSPPPTSWFSPSSSSLFSTANSQDKHFVVCILTQRARRGGGEWMNEDVSCGRLCRLCRSSLYELRALHR